MSMEVIETKTDSVCTVCNEPMKVIKQMFKGQLFSINVIEHANCKEYWEHLHFHKPQHYRIKKVCNWDEDSIRWSIGTTIMIWLIALAFEYGTSWFIPISYLIPVFLAYNFSISFLANWMHSGLPRFTKLEVPITISQDGNRE